MQNSRLLGTVTYLICKLGQYQICSLSTILIYYDAKGHFVVASGCSPGASNFETDVWMDIHTDDSTISPAQLSPTRYNKVLPYVTF